MGELLLDAFAGGGVDDVGGVDFAEEMRNGWVGYDYYWDDDGLQSFDDDCSVGDEKSRYCSQRPAG